ncbi:MAG: M28 family peptidase [Candidatus Krumholzibacteriota bacterium]|nr:M28 family peptidase [Candidatus Krumholzibacteriota bacterium]
MKRVIAVLCLLALAPPALAGAMAADTLRLRDTVDRLASPAMAGRRCGSPGGDAARRYLESGLRDLGLTPAGTVGFAQAFTVEGERLAAAAAVLVGADGDSLTLTIQARAPLRRSAVTRLRLWPNGAPPPACGPGEALVARGPSGREGFQPTLLRDRAAAAGAAALILAPHPADTAGVYARYVHRLSGRDLRLHRLPGDAPETPLLWAAAGGGSRLFSADSLRAGPWRLDLPAGEPFRLAGVNLVADSPGGTAADGLLLVAHYDHLGAGPGGVLPGADDNASGVATLLEFARLAADAPGWRLLLTDGEELGLLGARAYLREYGPPARVLNVDSVGRATVDSPRRIREPGAADPRLMMLWSAENAGGDAVRLRELLAARDFQVREARGPMFARGGDHAPFAEAGVPGLFVCGGFHADYETPRDLPERILFARLSDLAAALRDFAAAPCR